MQHADALLAPLRLRLPKALAVPLSLETERGGTDFSPAFLRFARRLIAPGQEAPTTAAADFLRKQVVAGISRMLEGARRRHAPRHARASHRAFAPLRVDLNPCLAPSPQEEAIENAELYYAPRETREASPGLHLTFRMCACEAADIGAPLACLEEQYPGARRALLEAMHAASTELPIITPWHLWDLFVNHVWCHMDTTESFLEEMGNMGAFEDRKELPGASPAQIAQAMGWITPADYRAAVHPDYIPPWAPSEQPEATTRLFPARARRRGVYPESSRNRLLRLSKEATDESTRELFDQAVEMLAWPRAGRRNTRAIDTTLSLDANLVLFHHDNLDPRYMGMVRGLLDDVFQQQAEYGAAEVGGVLTLRLDSHAAAGRAQQHLERWFDHYAFFDTFLTNLTGKASDRASSDHEQIHAT